MSLKKHHKKNQLDHSQISNKRGPDKAADNIKLSSRFAGAPAPHVEKRYTEDSSEQQSFSLVHPRQVAPGSTTDDRKSTKAGGTDEVIMSRLIINGGILPAISNSIPRRKATAIYSSTLTKDDQGDEEGVDD